MPGSTLWLYLKDGRGDVKLTDAWNGAEPTKAGTVDAAGVWNDDGGEEAGDPYRDIFFVAGVNGGYRATTTIAAGLGAGTATTESSFPSLVSGLRITNPSLVQVVSTTPVEKLAGTLVATDSDEKSHTPPRQYLKISTWTIFTEELEGGGEGPKLHVRTASIEGWGRNPRV
jgi:hypothetical protein